MKKIATTKYIAGQKNYTPPTDLVMPEIRVDVYNKRKNEWAKTPYHFELVIDKKKLKTDEEIKIYY